MTAWTWPPSSPTAPAPGGPLTAARTVYVDSVSGNDSNPGTSAAPFKTLARAWTDRQTFGVLRAQYTVQLRGVGPYTMPLMAASTVDVGAGGLFVVKGDPSARVVQAFGTATGDFAAFTLPTSAGVGGVNVRRFEYLLMTSGACAGASMLINDNTDTSITVANKQARTTLGAIANGDTFQVIRPGTVINTPTPASGQLSGGLYDLEGGIDPLYNSLYPAHWFYDLEFTGQLRTNRACYALLQCRLTGGLFSLNCRIRCAMIENSFALGIGGNTVTHLLWGAGVSTHASTSIQYNSTLWGVISWNAFFSVGAGTGGSALFWGGGLAANDARFNGGETILNTWGLASENRKVIWQITLDASATAIFASGTAVWTFAVTTGSCFLVKGGATLRIQNTTGMSGGTSVAGAYGVDVRGGGKAYFVGVAPVLTGGTPGQDLRTTATAVAANAVLGATPSTVDAAGSPYGEVLARVA